MPRREAGGWGDPGRRFSAQRQQVLWVPVSEVAIRRYTRCGLSNTQGSPTFLNLGLCVHLARPLCPPPALLLVRPSLGPWSSKSAAVTEGPQGRRSSRCCAAPSVPSGSSGGASALGPALARSAGVPERLRNPGLLSAFLLQTDDSGLCCDGDPGWGLVLLPRLFLEAAGPWLPVLPSWLPRPAVARPQQGTR